MAVITTGSFAKAIYPGLNAIWGQSYAQHTKEYADLFDVQKSTRNYEEDLGVSGLGLAPVKSEGGSISFDTEQQTYVSRYTNVVYGLGVIITREMMEDDLYDVVGGRRTKGLAFSINQTIETVSANIYNNAFTAGTGGDGSFLCVSTHATSSGNQSNILSVAADLSEASLEQMCININNSVNDRGLKIAIMPQTLIVPPSQAFEAERILKSSLQNDTALNALNAIKSTGVLPGGYKVNHYLTDNDAWFLRTNCPEGLKFFMRRAPAFEMDNDSDTQNAKFLATVRFVPKWTDWRGLSGSPGV
jgi:hypothetical protein